MSITKLRPLFTFTEERFAKLPAVVPEAFVSSRDERRCHPSVMGHHRYKPFVGYGGGQVLLLKEWFGVILTVLMVSGCMPTQSEPTPSANMPRVVAVASKTPDNILIRVDWVRVGSNVGDSDGVGEFRFDMLVKRAQQKSSRLQYPGTGTYRLQPGSLIPLSDFSLSVNKVYTNETILVFFFAFDEDEQSIWVEEATDSAGQVQNLL